MEIKRFPFDFSCFHVKTLDSNLLNNPYTFIGNTPSEKSVICITKDVPKDAFDVENNFKCFRLEGEYDFSLIGIASYITTLLKNNSISVLVVSTYNTDYFFVNKNKFDKAIELLEKDGNIIK